MAHVIFMTNGELYHHGILGQKWGVRRYQDKDGDYTELEKSVVIQIALLPNRHKKDIALHIKDLVRLI